MRCAACGFENPPGMRFCGGCGAPQQSLCPSCGFDNPPGFKFCGQCGTALAAVPAAGDQPAPPGEPEAERRQLTVLFCDLVGSTSLSERLDPEELREIVSSYQQVCFKVVERYSGHVAQYLGDGILVYFGWPQAHEDDARRAVHAALGMVDAVAALNGRLESPEVELAVRLGIHTGPVVTGEMGAGDRRETLALGQTPNVAARLQGLAEPGAVLLSAATQALVQGFFAFESLGPRRLKGISRPLEVFRVVGESGVDSTFEVARSQGLTPRVGREEELARLLELFRSAREDGPRMALVTGEAGIGKSRLVELFRERLAGERHTWVTCRSSAYLKASALHPVIDLLGRALRLRRRDSPRAKLRKIEALARSLGLPPGEVVPVVAPLLSVPLEDSRYPPLKLSPEERRERTEALLLTALARLGRRGPVVLLVEDLHWIDPTSLELLGRLVEPESPVPVLALTTSRPSLELPWEEGERLTRVTLERLTEDQVAAMVRSLAGGRDLPQEVLAQVVARTDGVPLFVEELTKMVLESDLLREESGRLVAGSGLGRLDIPTTLRDSLTARLDRLASAREVAQLGATLGRDFSFEVLAAVSPFDDDRLDRELERLVEAGLLFRQGNAGEASYSFKHALIQEAAYQTLLRRKRQEIHRKIARVLEERFPEMVAPRPELLAHHYTAGRLPEEAIVHWQRAGRQAAERGANAEAVSHLTQGLELVGSVAASPERDRRELELSTTLGPALMATRGFAAAEVEEVYGRARELCGRMGDDAGLYPVVWGLVRFYSGRGENPVARELGEQLLRLAEAEGKPDLLLEANRILGSTLFQLGELPRAREHLEAALALFEGEGGQRSQTFLSMQPGVFCLFYHGYVLWHLGRPDEALARVQQAEALARALGQPVLSAVAHLAGAMTHCYRREGEAAVREARAIVEICREHQLSDWPDMAAVLEGWGLAAGGEVAPGIARMEEGIGARRQATLRTGLPQLLGLLAEGYAACGRPGDGLAALAEALKLAQETGELYYRAELLRLQGELQLAGDGGEPEAERSFAEAVATARRQGSVSLELRAALSLARLRRRQDRAAEARELLAGVYGRFEEGFETADLTAARGFLEELPPPA